MQLAEVSIENKEESNVGTIAYDVNGERRHLYINSNVGFDHFMNVLCKSRNRINTALMNAARRKVATLHANQDVKVRRINYKHNVRQLLQKTYDDRIKSRGTEKC